MERNDLILQALADGPAGSAALVARTGLPPSTVKRALRHLLAGDYVFASGPARYRLTARGRAVSPEPAAPMDREATATARTAAPTVARETPTGDLPPVQLEKRTARSIVGPVPPKRRLDVTL